ncbi:hypothetical protein NC651_031227 [Populus alba x Populus x berolinensis]|nr:hypothetical protein NC651_031227 [Populus alba x Populus x berolinensis]
MNMQTMGDFPDGEWDFSRLMFSMEEPDFTPELLGQCSFPRENDEGLQFTIPPAFFPPPEANVSMAGNESLFYSWNALSPNLHFDSQESGNNSNCSSGVFLLLPAMNPTSSMILTAFRLLTITPCPWIFRSWMRKLLALFMPVVPEIAMGETACMNGDMSTKRKLDVPESNTLDDMKKKPRITRNVQKNAQSSSSCSSEDDNASKDSDSKFLKLSVPVAKQEPVGELLTDPQSLYARKRRERINERLKILQKIVLMEPSFLSSDDLWMYAPLAYSGIDIGLDQNAPMLL